MKPISAILQEIRPEYDFTASQDYLSDGMLDSFDMMTLVAALEKHYSVSIPGTAIAPENFRNAQAIQEMLNHCGVHL